MAEVSMGSNVVSLQYAKLKHVINFDGIIWHNATKQMAWKYDKCDNFQKIFMKIVKYWDAWKCCDDAFLLKARVTSFDFFWFFQTFKAFDFRKVFFVFIKFHQKKLKTNRSVKLISPFNITPELISPSSVFWLEKQSRKNWK